MALTLGGLILQTRLRTGERISGKLLQRIAFRFSGLYSLSTFC